MSYIQVLDIKQMYERWTVGDEPSLTPTNLAYLAREGLPTGVSGFEYPAATGTNTPYVLFVHGWNMTQYEKDRFAEAAFKRLYWQGYQGRFGSFRWPTDYGFRGTLWKVVSDPHNYDNSEFAAWMSSPGLFNKLQDLNGKYPGRVCLLAHSMGNVVAGEALHFASATQLVNTYVASQSAIPAHVYDSAVTNLIDFTHKNPRYPFSPANFGPTTPNIYGNYLASNSANAGRRINFFNPNDYALSPDAWCFNQELKPDTGVMQITTNWNYAYTGSTNDPAPWNNFSKSTLLPFGPLLTVNFDIVNSLLDRYEVFSYAAESRSKALGSTSGVGGLTDNLDLTTVWPTDVSGHGYADRFWHSAEFRGDCWQQWSYWDTLVHSSRFGFNLTTP